MSLPHRRRLAAGPGCACRRWNGMPSLVGTLLLLAAVAVGCGEPKSSWSWGSQSADTADQATSLQADPPAIQASGPPADSTSERATDPADEFEEFDEIEEELAEKMVVVEDPLEDWNRAMFEFNDGLYYHVAKPVLEGYAKVVPKDARIAIRHAFTNVGMPARLINCLLQGRWEDADTELRRFGINTTVGILGFSDPAHTAYGLEPVHADMGQTFAAHGLGEGCYLVWPVMGPSTVRDTGGAVPDAFLSPLTYLQPWAVKLGVSSGKGLNNGSLQVGVYEAMTSDAVDPYVAVRQAYIQYRRRQVQKKRQEERPPEQATALTGEPVGPPHPDWGS